MDFYMKLIVFGLCGLALMPRISSAHGIHFDSQELDEVSISMLQRRFRIGYNRSARLISILESKGLIMTVDGGKTRRVVK